MDLPQLGQVLRQRRSELKIPRTTLARRVGVSATYLWMVEDAHKRASGDPSRPSRALLSQLAAELQMSTAQRVELLHLAGHDVDEGGQSNGTVMDVSQSSVPGQTANGPTSLHDKMSNVLRRADQIGKRADYESQVSSYLDFLAHQLTDAGV